MKRIKQIMRRHVFAEKFFFLAAMFFITGIIGWLFETGYVVLFWNTWWDRGFLTMPVIPVYGFAAVLVYGLLRTPFKGMWRKLSDKVAGSGGAFRRAMGYVVSFAAYYLAATLLVNFVEFVGGFFLDKVLGIKLWDYSSRPYNLMGYICLDFFFMWGLFVTAYMAVADKWVHRIYHTYGKRNVQIALCALIVFALLDAAINGVYSLAVGAHLDLFTRYDGPSDHAIFAWLRKLLPNVFK